MSRRLRVHKYNILTSVYQAFSTDLMHSCLHFLHANSPMPS